jgi:hypothetical protein
MSGWDQGEIFYSDPITSQVRAASGTTCLRSGSRVCVTAVCVVLCVCVVCVCVCVFCVVCVCWCVCDGGRSLQGEAGSLRARVQRDLFEFLDHYRQDNAFIYRWVWCGVLPL